MNQRKDERFVGLQIFTKLRAVLGLTFFFVTDNLGTNKVFVNLRVKVVAVGDDKEGKVALNLTLDLAGKHNHRVGLTASLRMPKYAELACECLAIFNRLNQIINTEILVVLCDNLD